MLHIKTEVRPSLINGLGLFSKGSVKKGQLVWTYNPKLDRTFTPNYLETLPECVAEQISKYGYVNPANPELIVLCGDDARFLNFPERRANLALGEKRDDEHILIAARDIAADEELTVPLASDADAERKLATSIKTKSYVFPY